MSSLQKKGARTVVAVEEIVREQKEHIEAIERKVEKNRVNFEISRLLSHMKHPDRNANDPVSLEDNLEAAGRSYQRNPRLDSPRRRTGKRPSLGFKMIESELTEDKLFDLEAFAFLTIDRAFSCLISSVHVLLGEN